MDDLKDNWRSRFEHIPIGRMFVWAMQHDRLVLMRKKSLSSATVISGFTEQPHPASGCAPVVKFSKAAEVYLITKRVN